MSAEDALVFQNVFGVYDVYDGDRFVGSSALLGIGAEVSFIPKIFPLGSLLKNVNPLFRVVCSPIADGLGIPTALSQATSQVRIISLDRARYEFHLAILFRIALLMGFAIAAIYALPLCKEALNDAKRIAAQRIFYVTGFLFCFSMTRVPRIFIPALLPPRWYYLFHNCNEYLLLVSIGMLLLTHLDRTRFERTYLSWMTIIAGVTSVTMMSNHFSTRLQLGHVYGVMTQSGLNILLFISAPFLRKDNKSRHSPHTGFFLALGLASIALEFEVCLQHFRDAAVYIISPYFTASCLLIGAKTIRTEAMAKEKKDQTRLLSTVAQSHKAAHDIRSPLTALKVLSDVIPNLDGDHKSLLGATIQRIKEIADDLLPASAEIAPSSPLLNFIEALEKLINEKKMEYSKRPEIRITQSFHIPQEVMTKSVQVKLIQFTRAISNILNNSFEAIAAEGEISIRLAGTSDELTIRIADTGAGISEGNIKRLIRGNFSTKGGQDRGIGLAQVREMISSAGGTLNIKSREGSGTEIILVLPLKQNLV